jgi:predicted nucleic acid-binding protein
MTWYLDSNAFIYPALYEGPKADTAAALLRSITAGKRRAATASLTIDEVVWIISQEASRSVAIEQGRRLCALPNLQIVDVRATEMLGMLDHLDDNDHLRPRDGLHLAAMDRAGCSTIVSDDDDFDTVGGVTRRALDEELDDP